MIGRFFNRIFDIVYSYVQLQLQQQAWVQLQLQQQACCWISLLHNGKNWNYPKYKLIPFFFNHKIFEKHMNGWFISNVIKSGRKFRLWISVCCCKEKLMKALFLKLDENRESVSMNAFNLKINISYYSNFNQTLIEPNPFMICLLQNFALLRVSYIQSPRNCYRIWCSILIRIFSNLDSSLQNIYTI